MAPLRYRPKGVFGKGVGNSKNASETQRALRDRLMSRGKNCLPTVSRQFLTCNYPRPNCLLKCLPNCLPHKRGLFILFQNYPAVRVIARQVRDKNCLAAIFAPRHQSVSSGPLGMHQKCVRNTSKMRQNGSCFIGKRGTSKMRQKSVKIASTMRQKCAEHLWGRTPFGRYRPLSG